MSSGATWFVSARSNIERDDFLGCRSTSGRVCPSCKSLIQETLDSPSRATAISFIIRLICPFPVLSATLSILNQMNDALDLPAGISVCSCRCTVNGAILRLPPYWSTCPLAVQSSTSARTLAHSPFLLQTRSDICDFCHNPY